LECQHLLGYVVTEFHDLFADVMEESIAGPVADEHDCVDWTFTMVHDHCCAG